MKYTTLVITALLTLALALSAPAQTATNNPPDNTVGFVGVSADPNGGVASTAADIGVAKLVGTGTYLGVVAHLASKGVTPFQLTTKVQLHLAQRLPFDFGAMSTYWTAEVGPEFMSGVTGQPITTQLQVGYAVGSGPLVSIPLGKHTYLMPHAEVTKGSLQDLGWRGGVLFGFGSSK